MANDLREALDAIQGIRQWYWHHGVRRLEDADYALGADWLSRLTGIERRARLAAANAGRRRPSVAIYGDSQAGKSTMLMTELDRYADLAGSSEPERALSAVQWDDQPATWGDWSQWSHAASWVAQTVKPMNPYDDAKDATAVATRFVLASDVPDPLAPYRLTVQSFDAVMAAVYSGLCEYGDLAEPPRRVRGPELWSQAELRRELASAQAGFAVIESLYEIKRTKDLLIGRAAERMARVELPPIGEVFPCSRAQALRWVSEKLFGEDGPLFARLIDELIDVHGLLDGYDDIYCDPCAARRLLKFDHTGTQLMDGLVLKERTTPTGRQLTIFDEHEAPLDGESHELPYDGRAKQLAFQLALGELVVPVREDVLRDHNPELYCMLERVDLIDFPGLSTLADATEKLAHEHPQRQAFMLKSGKTACVLREYVATERLDGLIFVVRVESDLREITREMFNRVLSWWLEAEPDDGADAAPRPIWWAAVRWNRVAANEAIAKLRNNIKAVPLLSNCRFRLFATHYPLWPQMIASSPMAPEDTEHLVRELRQYIAGAASAESFRQLRVTALQPTERIDSTVGLWTDLHQAYEPFDQADAAAAGREPAEALWSALRDLLESKHAFPGGDQARQNRLRREKLDRLHRHVHEDISVRRRLFTVTAPNKAELARLHHDVTGRLGSGREGMFKGMLRLIRERWRQSAVQAVASCITDTTEREALVGALEASVWQVEPIREQLAEEFMPLLPVPSVADNPALDRLDSIAQLLTIRLGDWLAGGAEKTHGLAAHEMSLVFSNLAEQDAKFGDRVPLPGDTELSEIHGVAELWNGQREPQYEESRR